ncbi:hypothetical protein Tco_0775768, partial [Tanacetum coccineum]
GVTPQTWISQVACAKEPRTSFDELMDTSFDFSAFVLNRLNIKDMTQEILAGPVFELLKGTCKSLTELEYHLEECSKASTERLDWYNPEGKPYPFNLSKPLLLIRDHRGCQVIPQDFFINNDLKYLKGISHWGPKRQHFYGFTANMSSSNDVYFRKIIIAVTRLTIMKKYDYDYLEEIEVRREDQKRYKFREGDFPRIRLQDIEDLLNLRNRTTYTAYSDPKGVTNKDQMKTNRLMRADELHKFGDGTLNDVRSALNDIAKGIRMEYLPKRK